MCIVWEQVSDLEVRIEEVVVVEGGELKKSVLEQINATGHNQGRCHG